MSNIDTNWLLTDFDNFAYSTPIRGNPSMGISYRVRDSFPISSKNNTVLAYDITSKEQLSPDLDFIYSLNNKLNKLSGGNGGDFYFKLKLATTLPLDQPNTFGNFLYAHFGTTEEMHRTDPNSKSAKQLIDKIGSELTLWSLKNNKKPTEIVFNYNFCNLQNENQGEIEKVLKGHNLDKFIKSISS